MNKKTKNPVLLGSDFNTKLVGKPLFKVNQVKNLVEQFFVKGMYRDGVKIFVGIADDNGVVSHISYSMNEPSGFYLTKFDANNSLLDNQILSVTNRLKSAERHLLARENQINLLNKKLALEKGAVTHLKKELEQLKSSR